MAKFKAGDYVRVKQKGGISPAVEGQIVRVTSTTSGGHITKIENWGDWYVYHNDWYELVHRPNNLHQNPSICRTLADYELYALSSGLLYGQTVLDCKFLTNKKKPIMSRLSIMMKKLLDADTQTLVKAGYINGDLDLTEAGRVALTSILFSEKKSELVKLAEADLEEAKENKCK